MSQDRLTGLPLLLLVYPCLTFGRDCDPRELARGARLTAAEVRAQFAARINGLIEKLGIVQEASSSTDDRWYWLAPMLLDFAEFPVAAQNGGTVRSLAQTWAGIEMGEEDEGWSAMWSRRRRRSIPFATVKNILAHRRTILRSSGPRGLRCSGHGCFARLRARKPK